MPTMNIIEAVRSALQTQMRADPRVVVLGGGFGGLACARALRNEPVDVVLVDRRNYHLFTPLLYQVASCLLNPSEIAIPVRSFHARQVASGKCSPAEMQ